jgi:phosphoesterase RecJ-like protein
MDRFAHHCRLAADDLVRAGRVTIVIHRKPDGDALGAASAMLAWCRTRGVAATVFCRDEAPPQYAFLDGAHEFTTDQATFHGCPLVAVFDAGDLRYAGVADLLDALPVRPRLLNFDHHADNVCFGAVNVVDGTATSTCEIIHRFHLATASPIAPAVATALLTGILFDTGSLSNPATSAVAIRVAAELMRLGGSMHDYNMRILKSKSIAGLRLWGEALGRLKHNAELDFASTALYAHELATADVPEEEVEGLSNFLSTFLDTRGVFFLKEMPEERVKGSLRTKEDLDVSIPARLLGGGGHQKAAGFTIRGRIVETETGFRIEPALAGERRAAART